MLKNLNIDGGKARAKAPRIRGELFSIKFKKGRGATREPKVRPKGRPRRAILY